MRKMCPSENKRTQVLPKYDLLFTSRFIATEEKDYILSKYMANLQKRICRRLWARRNAAEVTKILEG